MENKKSEKAAKSTPDTSIAVCLSGGGYRSALFHLGALRRLHELGILHDLTAISSVSGGSILAGFLADLLISQNIGCDRKQLRQFFDNVNWEETISKPFRQVTKKDIRTRSVLFTLYKNFLFPQDRMERLEKSYKQNITEKTLKQLPESLKFIFCATDITFGINWEFTKHRVGSYMAGYIKGAENWPIARAIAASSSFPPVFGPMQITEDPANYKKGRYKNEDKEKLLAKVSLTDGGVYDNLGIEPVWKKSSGYSMILVSDAGAPFEFSTGKHYFSRLLRYSTVITKQVESLRKRYFYNLNHYKEYQGAIWQMKSTTDNHSAGYSKELIDNYISKVRTDLDRFLEAEAKVLENHGYYSCDFIMNKNFPDMETSKTELKPPHSEWMDEDKVKVALKNSHKRFCISRLLFSE